METEHNINSSPQGLRMQQALLRINTTNYSVLDTFKVTRLSKVDELLDFDEPIHKCECKYRGVMDCKTVAFNRYSSVKYRTIHLLFCQFTEVEHPLLADYINYLKRNMYIVGLNIIKLNKIYPIILYLTDCYKFVNKYFGTEHLYEIKLCDPFINRKTITDPNAIVRIDSAKKLIKIYNLLIEYQSQNNKFLKEMEIKNNK